MTGDSAVPAAGWDGDATAPLARDTTMRSARRAPKPGAAEDRTIVVRRVPASAAAAVDAAPPVTSRRVASSPDVSELRAPYVPRTAPGVVPRAEHASSTAGSPVDSEAIAREIRDRARLRAIAVGIVSASVLVAAGTLLAVLVSGAA